VDDGGIKFEIELTQQYQEIQGSARMGDTTTVLRETSLRGDEIRFIVELQSGQLRVFRGRVTGNRIESLPAVTGEAAPANAASWKASRGS
jgi:hypothetical protein